MQIGGPVPPEWDSPSKHWTEEEHGVVLSWRTRGGSGDRPTDGKNGWRIAQNLQKVWSQNQGRTWKLKVSFLDMTQHLKEGIFEPYWKEDNAPPYINKHPNNPPAIKRERENQTTFTTARSQIGFHGHQLIEYDAQIPCTKFYTICSIYANVMKGSKKGKWANFMTYAMGKLGLGWEN